MSTPVVSFHNVWKIYHTDGGGRRVALQHVSFAVSEGETVAILGRSGSGKSTLLHLTAGIDVPTQGTIAFRGANLSTLPDRERTLLRRSEIGLVFQFFHLLPHLSVKDNIALPELIAGGRPGAFEARVLELLDRVGLADRADDNVQKLSGGEMQRVAICRALLKKPGLLLADEPTGNLDDENGQIVMNLMLSLASEEKSTLIYVTHSPELAALANETWQLTSGSLERP